MDSESYREYWTGYHSGRFLYNANALALGGNAFPAQGSAVLPIVGGMGEGRVEGFVHEALGLKARGAEVLVSGSFDETNQIYRTTANAEIKHYQMGDVFEARQLDGGLISTHTTDLNEQVRIVICAPNPLQFTLKGRLVEVFFNDELMNIETYADLQERWCNPAFRKRHARRVYRAGLTPLTIARSNALPQDHQMAFYSIVEHIRMDHQPADVEIYGNMINVPSFGKIYLGEVNRDRHVVRLNLLRFVLEKKLCDVVPHCTSKDPVTSVCIATQANGCGSDRGEGEGSGG